MFPIGAWAMKFSIIDNFQSFTILKWLLISRNCDFDTVMRKLETLVLGGGDGLHGMQPRSAKEKIIGEVKINYVT